MKGGRRANGCVRAREAERACVWSCSVKTSMICHVPGRDLDHNTEYGASASRSTVILAKAPAGKPVKVAIVARAKQAFNQV